MKSLLTILAFHILISAGGQDSLPICNCLKYADLCIPDMYKRTIVSSDTILGHHTFCLTVLSMDKNDRIIVSTTLCDKIPTSHFLQQFYDPAVLGDRSETWYDTTGKFIYTTYSKYKITKECYWYHYTPGQKNYDYIKGYRNGELFKEMYTWDQYESSYVKKVIVTAKLITTILYTDNRDKYGNCIQKKSSVPNRTGKID